MITVQHACVCSKTTTGTIAKHIVASASWNCMSKRQLLPLIAFVGVKRENFDMGRRLRHVAHLCFRCGVKWHTKDIVHRTAHKTEFELFFPCTVVAPKTSLHNFTPRSNADGKCLKPS
ncbi:hypothetical protein TRVL_05278 [Trypanosoma vivax]|nr:hypothetical protein TRVL_05278 [Trypanosoma vivax]